MAPGRPSDVQRPAGSGPALTGRREFGDRFAILPGVPEAPGWVTADHLFGPGLAPALDAVGAARGTGNGAVAGSLLVDVYAQRLVAPVLAALYVDGAVLDAALPQVRVQPVEGRLRRVAFAGDPTPTGPDVDRARRTVVRGLVDANLAPVIEAVRNHTRLGERVLWGAVANAVAITFLHLSWPGPDRARYVGAAREFLAEVPGLPELVTVESALRAGRRWMYTDRNTCCLAFRTTVNQAREQPYCSTCPVLSRDVTRRLFGDATATYDARRTP